MFYFLTLAALTLISCSSQDREVFLTTPADQLYSTKGRELNVQFKADYRTAYSRIQDVNLARTMGNIQQTTQFLFGPLTRRQLAAPQKGEKIEILKNEMKLVDGQVHVPYVYSAVWLIHKDVATENSLTLPVPLSIESLKTPKWRNCTESDPEHGTWSFLWYFWDPSRYGCDHKVDSEYMMVSIQMGRSTPQTTTSYPEYKRMIRDRNGQKTLSMTFAFGYVKDHFHPKPFNDSDAGAREFQIFHSQVEKVLTNMGFSKEPVYRNEYGGSSREVLGSRFIGEIGHVQVRVSVVAAAGIDQMELFAHSYATLHEGFFGWFGHSRVGSGFDADRFAMLVKDEPQNYSMTSDYQLIYWAGCNSYSYYTLPFFEMKSDLSPLADPYGTKNLDLLSNGLPSYFSLNAKNADVVFKALISWQKPTSYQRIVDQIEKDSGAWGTSVLVNVLGDEDNPLL